MVSISIQEGKKNQNNAVTWYTLRSVEPIRIFAMPLDKMSALFGAQAFAFFYLSTPFLIPALSISSSTLSLPNFCGVSAHGDVTLKREYATALIKTTGGQYNHQYR
jgi:hypothetical protein